MKFNELVCSDNSQTVVSSEACCWFKSIFVTVGIVHIWSKVSAVGSPRESTDCGIHYIINHYKNRDSSSSYSTIPPPYSIHPYTYDGMYLGMIIKQTPK